LSPAIRERLDERARSRFVQSRFATRSGALPAASGSRGSA
jgi:hypothetical protein